MFVPIELWFKRIIFPPSMGVVASVIHPSTIAMSMMEERVL